MPTGLAPEPFLGGNSLFLRHPSTSLGCAACSGTQGAALTRCDSGDCSGSPVSCLHLPQPPHRPRLLPRYTSTDRGCLSTSTSPSSSLWRLWSACSEKEGKKSQPFNHIFNQLSRNSCVTPVGTQRAQAYSPVSMGKSSMCEVKSSMTTIHMTSQNGRVP